MMLPEEEDEAAGISQQKVPEAPTWPSVEKSPTTHRPDKLDLALTHDLPGSSRINSHHSSSHRDRMGRNDDEYHRSTRDKDRSGRDRERDRDHVRDRDRDRDRNLRDRSYGSTRHRDSYRERNDRYDRRDRRDRRSRSPEERAGENRGRRHSSRSRSRSRDTREHRDHRRSPRNERSHGGASSREVPRERVTQDRLSAEIEQELANLRRQHDLKEALKKEQAKGVTKDARKASNKPKKLVPAFTVLKPQKPDFVPYDAGLSAPANAEYVPEIQTEEERIEFQRKMQEKLQQHLASEGKLYPPPTKTKSEPPPPAAVSGFVNDGSFLEMFKKFQEHQAPSGLPTTSAVPLAGAIGAVGTANMLGYGSDKQLITPVAGVVSGAISNNPVVAQNLLGTGAPLTVLPGPISIQPTKPIVKEPPPPPLPVFGRRRGGKILKTGLVKKVRPIEESAAETPNDPWSLYLQEVKKYKSASCDADSKTRPLVK